MDALIRSRDDDLSIAISYAKCKIFDGPPPWTSLSPWISLEHTYINLINFKLGGFQGFPLPSADAIIN